jgi:LacI family transcriptional regulator
MQGINGGDQPLDIHIFTLREDGLISATQLVDHHVDGVIMLGVENDAYLRDFVTWGVPGVVVDYFAAGLSLDFVACDNPSATQRSVMHLFELGHRNICYVGSEPVSLEKIAGAQRMEARSADFIERREVAIRTMDAMSVRWQEAVMSRFYENRVAMVGRLVAAWRVETERPTAFLVDGDDLANILMRELVTQGVSVPDEVSICTVATATGSTEMGLALTGAHFDFVGMGRKAVELLKWRCENPTEALPPAVYRIGFRWVEGQTCGKIGNG